MYTSTVDCDQTVPDFKMLRKFRKDTRDANANHMANVTDSKGGGKKPPVLGKQPPATKPKPKMGLSRNRPASVNTGIDYSVHSAHSHYLTDKLTTTHHRPLTKSQSHRQELASTSGYDSYSNSDIYSYCRGEGVRTVVLARTKKGYGFVLRGAKGKSIYDNMRNLALLGSHKKWPRYKAMLNTV